MGVPMIIPTIMYHAISKETKSNKYIIDEKQLLRQLEYLSDQKYTSISALDYYRSLIDPLCKIPEKSVVITFDDGHESDFTIALPLLKKYNFTANFFVTTDWIGKTGYMNPNQLRSLRKEGMLVQSHAKTHAFLDNMTGDEINIELVQSKKTLEDVLGEEIACISFPGGRYNDAVIQGARAAHYSALFCSRPFSAQRCEDIYVIGRYAIKQQPNNSEFEKAVHLDSFFTKQTRALYRTKYLLKKVVGTNVYYQLWKKINKK
jgi:peptidoglycan/xylan/chitin deacetylase (PgdA/CDA1 family)